MLRPAPLKWGVILAVWTLYALLDATRAFVDAGISGTDVRWNDLLLTLAGIYTWAVLTPVVIRVSRRHPLGRDTWGRLLAAHGLAILVLVPLDIGTFSLLDHFVFHSIEWEEPLGLGEKTLRVASWAFGFSIFWYVAVAAFSHAMDYRLLLRDGELRAARLETRLARAQLDVLRLQLQPHFLFNTLHSISALVNEDPPGADRMLHRLRELLRLSLEGGERQEVALREELAFLEAYLDIERTRFEDRLQLEVEVDPEALDVRVPSLLLQPLVENAIRHGLGSRAGTGRISVRARTDAGQLRIEVADDGRGLPPGGLPREGVGLGNTRARLAQLYGGAHRFQVHEPPEGGLTVTIDLPARAASPPEPALAGAAA
ncbi:MAG TPA: histidine kinase [Gemmatimonadota bacterium]|jgi:signal transduction histidine kinase